MKVENPKRKFKGIWIPKKIWISEELSTQEKVFLAEIDSLEDEKNGCFASNKYFAEFFGLNKKTVSCITTALCSRGYIISKIDKKNGNKRSLRVNPEIWQRPIPESGDTPIPENRDSPYPRKWGEGLPENKDTPIPENRETIIPKLYNKADNKTKGVEFSAQHRLDLDLKIAQQAKLLSEQIAEFLHPNAREINTFKNIIKHLIRECQGRRLQLSIFRDAAKWARLAAESNAINKKALFVAKVKEQTGFKKQDKILKGIGTLGSALSETKNNIFKE